MMNMSRVSEGVDVDAQGEKYREPGSKLFFLRSALPGPKVELMGVFNVRRNLYPRGKKNRWGKISGKDCDRIRKKSMAVINPNSNESTRVLVEERLRLCSGDGMELEALGGKKSSKRSNAQTFLVVR